MNKKKQEILVELLKHCSDLSKELLMEVDVFNPFAFFYESERHSLIFSEDENSYDGLKEYFEKNNIGMYVMVKCVKVKGRSAIELITVVDDIEYETMFISYQKIDNQVILSDLLSEDDFLEYDA